MSTRNDQNAADFHKPDEPPFSRIYLSYPKEATKQELNDAFKKFGVIEDVWLIRGRTSKAEIGVAYIKFAKASYAARACEEMDGKYLYNYKKPLRINISAPKGELIKNPSDEFYKQMSRLYVTIDKNASKYDLIDAFKKYGHITNTHILYDRQTKKCKERAYITFSKSSEAARALEECDKCFRARFAEPQEPHPDKSNSNSSTDIKFNNNFYQLDSKEEQNTNRDHFDHQTSYNMNDDFNSNVKKVRETSYNLNDDYNSNVKKVRETSYNLNDDYNSNVKTEENDFEYNYVVNKTTSNIKKYPIENVCIQISDNKTDRKVLILDENKPTMDLASRLKPPSSSLSSSSKRDSNLIKNGNNDSPILLVKSSMNEVIVRKMFDLIPGLIEFGVYLPGYQFNNQYLVRYENELIAAYAVEKLSSFEFPNGDNIQIEYFNKSKNIQEQQKCSNQNEEFIKSLISHNSTNSNANNIITNLSNDNNMSNLGKNVPIQQDQLQTLSSFVLISTLLNQLDKNQISLNNSNQSNNNNTQNFVCESIQNSISETSIHSQTNFSQDSNKVSDKNKTTIVINCQKEITKELLYLIMSQFNNFIEVHLNEDKKNGYATFSSELDALLAVNTINHREIANNYFTARIQQQQQQNNTSYNSNNNNNGDSSYKKESSKSYHKYDKSHHSETDTSNGDYNRDYRDNKNYNKRSYNNGSNSNYHNNNGTNNNSKKFRR